MIGPAVIAALEFIGIAFVGRDHHRAAMRTLIAQNLKFSGGVAHDDNRLARNLSAEEVADIPDLALVADIDPGGAEDALELKFKDRRVGVEAAMNASGLHKVRESVS
jgi:hypothetical protein